MTEFEFQMVKLRHTRTPVYFGEYNKHTKELTMLDSSALHGLDVEQVKTYLDPRNDLWAYAMVFDTRKPLKP